MFTYANGNLEDFIKEMKKLNENLSEHTIALEKVADQIDELGMEIYKYRMGMGEL